MSGSLLTVVTAMLSLGVASQLVAQRLRVPSVLLYLLVGVAIGSSGLGLVTFETFGDSLSTVVGVAVAIIVFDGAFALRFERVRAASTVTLRLVTVGALVTFGGTTLAVHYLLGASWDIAAVVGALLVATGPTVITPIVQVVDLREHVATALETEGIVNDVTAAVTAVVLFETLVLADVPATTTAVGFLERVAAGAVVGTLVAAGAALLLRRVYASRSSLRAAKFVAVVVAVGAYGAAEVLAAEAGIAAAAVAGVTLGNVELPHHEEMEEFAEDLTLLFLSFVFIGLAALIDLGAVAGLGLAGVALVVVVVGVLRPLVALLSTAGVARFSWPERGFVAAVGPRGIVPTAVATLFALDLAEFGRPAAAELLAGTVFLVIFATVALQAGPARQIGDRLGVTPMRTIIVGGGRVGLALATRLENRGEFVVVVEDDPDQLAAAREDGFTVQEGDGTDAETLRAAGVETAGTVIAATADDDVNLLVCQLAATKFGVESVYSRVNEPGNVDAFDSLEVTAVDGPTATAYAIDNEIERPELAHWMNDLGDGHDVQEVEVSSEEVDGMTVRAVNDLLPGGVLIAELGRGTDAHVPEPDDTIELGDHVTFLGESDAVATAIERFHPR